MVQKLFAKLHSEITITFQTSIELPKNAQIRASIVFKDESESVVSRCPFHLSKTGTVLRRLLFYLLGPSESLFKHSIGFSGNLCCCCNMAIVETVKWYSEEGELVFPFYQKWFYHGYFLSLINFLSNKVRVWFFGGSCHITWRNLMKASYKCKIFLSTNYFLPLYDGNDRKKLYSVSPLFEILCERLQMISLQHVIGNGPHIGIFLDEDKFVLNLLNQLPILLHSIAILVHFIWNPFFHYASFENKK